MSDENEGRSLDSPLGLAERFNPNHVPAGSGAGGEFAPAGAAQKQKAKPRPTSSKQKAKPAAKKPASDTLSYDGKSGTGYGVKGGDPRVRRLQQALNRLGLKDADGKRLVIDGKYGPRTTAAVKAAQRRLGVEPTGKATPQLMDRLADASDLPAKPRSPRRDYDVPVQVRAEMSGASINDLPDSAFAYIEPGGHKDADGRTAPRSLRHFPIHDAAHVRNALARARQSPFGAKAMPKIREAAKKFGIKVEDSGRALADEMTKEGPGMAAAVERRFTLVPVELRMVGDRPRIGGYAAMFERVSRNLGGFVEVVERSFFNKSRGDGWPDVLARYNHDDNMLLGTTGAGTLTLRLDETGLDYDVDPPTSRGDVVELVQRGDVRKSSFAFRLPPGGDDWGLSDQGYPLRKLVTGALVDVAPVNAPAYQDTSASMRSLDPEVRRLGIGPEAAYRSLAERMDADVDEVWAAAEDNELHRFFRVTSGAPMPGPKPKPRTQGAAALVALLAKREDPWGE